MRAPAISAVAAATADTKPLLAGHFPPLPSIPSPPPNLRGKEGIDRSSPSEGSTKHAAWILLLLLAWWGAAHEVGEREERDAAAKRDVSQVVGRLSGLVPVG
jgi:hypothetical protein